MLAVLYVVSLASFGLVKLLTSSQAPVKMASQLLVLIHVSLMRELRCDVHWQVHCNSCCYVICNKCRSTVSVPHHGRIRRGREGIEHHLKSPD
jgi:hypothetical protein